METSHATAADSASTLPSTPAPAYGFTRLASIGNMLGLAAMAALFLHGRAVRESGLMAVSSSTAAVLGAAWASTTVIRERLTRT